MCDASEYGTFYSDLTEELLPYLPRNGHICDAGCGLGYLAESLSRYCDTITAIDISQAAIEAFVKRCARDNLSIRCESIFEIDAVFDAMIFCYFGKTDEILALAKKLCRGNVIVIRRDCSEHTFSLGTVTRKHHSADNLTQTLRDKQVPFVQKQLRIEMGQPLRNFDDAVSFFGLYNKSEQEVTAELVRNRLINTENSEFPLYLPSVRQMELIVFSANHI